MFPPLFFISLSLRPEGTAVSLSAHTFSFKCKICAPVLGIKKQKQKQGAVAAQRRSRVRTSRVSGTTLSGKSPEKLGATPSPHGEMSEDDIFGRRKKKTTNRSPLSSISVHGAHHERLPIMLFKSISRRCVMRSSGAECM